MHVRTLQPHAHVQSSLCFCFLSFLANHRSFAKPFHSFFFLGECTLEHLHKLVSIHPPRLTRMVALFPSNLPEGPVKKNNTIKNTTQPEGQHLCLRGPPGVCGAPGEPPNTAIPRNRGLWSEPVSMGSPFPVKRSFCESRNLLSDCRVGVVPHSRRALDLAQKQHVWVLDESRASVRSRETGSPRGSDQRKWTGFFFFFAALTA